MIKKIIYTIAVIAWLWAALQIWFADNTTQNQFWAWDWREIWVVGVWTNDDGATEPKAFTIIRKTINRVLSLLWVIALVFCLIWWFKMLTAAWDDAKVKTWWKILKNAAIWLVVIWLSWIIVRLVFN